MQDVISLKLVEREEDERFCDDDNIMESTVGIGKILNMKFV